MIGLMLFIRHVLARTLLAFVPGVVLASAAMPEAVVLWVLCSAGFFAVYTGLKRYVKEYRAAWPYLEDM